MVCTSNMKLIRARSSLAPRPIYRAKRAPAIFAARSKSRIPSLSPISQWGKGSKLKERRSPTVLMTTLSSLSLPVGTESCGRLGSSMSMECKVCSCSESSSSKALILWETSRISAMSSEASFWPLFIWAIRSETMFRSCLSSSASSRIARRLASQPRKSRRSYACPRLRRDASTNSTFCLMNFVSSTERKLSLTHDPVNDYYYLTLLENSVTRAPSAVQDLRRSEMPNGRSKNKES